MQIYWQHESAGSTIAIYSVPVHSSFSFDAYGRNRRAGFILLDNLFCNPLEDLGLEDCRYSNHTRDCTHQQDVSVACLGSLDLWK